MASFDELAAEALAAPVSGWDFSWLAGRYSTGQLPWDYHGEVARRAASADAMLDMGTGGGERLSRLAPRPRRTVATEGWPPNVPVAANRLRPLGIAVVQDEGAPDNTEQDPGQRPLPGQDGERGRLPFRDAAFSLVASRHEAFRAAEVSRVLRPGGTFATQQVDSGSSDSLRELLGLPSGDRSGSWLPLARRQVRDAGLVIERAAAGEEEHRFRDIAAVIYYLRIVEWAIPEYSFEACRDRLRAAWDQPGRWPLGFRQRLFLLVAVKPGSGSRPGD
jgi:SAM-dependent methyltransferase